MKVSSSIVFTWSSVLCSLIITKSDMFTYSCSLSCVYSQGLNNIIHIDFDYKKEFIYWVDSTRPTGRKINRMRLNGSDLKVPQGLVTVTACHMVACATFYPRLIGFTLVHSLSNLDLWSFLFPSSFSHTHTLTPHSCSVRFAGHRAAPGHVSGGNEGGARAVFHFPPLRSIPHIRDMKQRSTSQNL